MKIPFTEPAPAGSERARAAKAFRDLSTEISRLSPQALTRTNGEEQDHGPKYPASFTKGLAHDDCGLLADDADYHCLVEAINGPDHTAFDKHVRSAPEAGASFTCGIDGNAAGDTRWRGWESPRAGHVLELEGPDAGAVGMAPAPRVGSSELAAEMAELYGLAILRDVPFATICEGGGDKLCEDEGGDNDAHLNASQVVDLLNEMPFFQGGAARRSSTPHNIDESGLNAFERNRRFARTLSPSGQLETETVFRGSTRGAQVGPYVSQFLLIGSGSLAGTSNGTAHPETSAQFGPQQGMISYGSLTIDQRTLTHKACVDHLTEWCAWLDVQNGANFKSANLFEGERRFITTPRDLATYVHFDALYEAYLNACLILLAMGTPASKGFPEPSPTGKRDAFATFGGPHVLSLVCEVATRCLKAVRRQKFNYHRRARPEAIGGRLALACLLAGEDQSLEQKLGCSAGAFTRTLDEIPGELREAIVKHNAEQNTEAMADMRRVTCPQGCTPGGVDAETFADCNLLLPMAFPEGSPMHPAYGAGHATVAGGCVTMLKAFFEMFTDCDSNVERPLLDGNGDPMVYVPNADGTELETDGKFEGVLTIQGELDKLAANISIGRNMAGVHYYSDYYDSLRMGERVAVGILMEQAPCYGEAVEMTFKSFDGDMITVSGEGGSCPTLSILDRRGTPVRPASWWLRHVSGGEPIEDLS